MEVRFRALVGYMPQQQGYYEQFSARNFLYYMAELKGIKKKEARRQITELIKIADGENLEDVYMHYFNEDYLGEI